MSSSENPLELLDLKMMPAWVNEPTRKNDYADYQGEEERAPFDRGGRPPRRDRDQRSHAPKRETREGGRRPEKGRAEGGRPPERRDDRRPEREAPAPLPQVGVRFLPHPPAFESVIAQIKSDSLTYSVFALARMFLDKPERYDVRLTAAEGAVLYRLGENGPVATDPRILEDSAFFATKDDFYTVEETQTEPLKGNFSNVARCRLSGTLLGPTNHHAYQPQLRNLYEQRFSRRMSFPDYQRQIEIVSDPVVVEQWKEQARSVTTYRTKGLEPELAFSSAAEAERHFKQTHLPTLLQSVPETTVSGVISRRLRDRGLGHVIENAWSAEIRSPSKMMQELAAGLRMAGLNIFRHRKGMLFVSPFRIRAFGHERSSVSTSINAILEKLAQTPGMNRKQLAEKTVPAESEAAEADRLKRTLASDLHWLVHEGYVIEFNDGTLDLPRAKAPPPAAAPEKRKEVAPAGGTAAEPAAGVTETSEAAKEQKPASEAAVETAASQPNASEGTDASASDSRDTPTAEARTEEFAPAVAMTVEQTTEPVVEEKPAQNDAS